jgi:hypothetical protein
MKIWQENVEFMTLQWNEKKCTKTGIHVIRSEPEKVATAVSSAKINW